MVVAILLSLAAYLATGGGYERELPPDLAPADTGSLLVASTRDGWALLGDDYFQRSVDGQWQDPQPIEIIWPPPLRDPGAFVTRHELISTQNGFAFVALHRRSNPNDVHDPVGTAYRLVSADGVRWEADSAMRAIEAVDPLRVIDHSDDGFSIVRRTSTTTSGLATEVHNAGSAYLTVLDGEASRSASHLAAVDGLRRVERDGSITHVVEWESPYVGDAMFAFTPDGTRVVRMSRNFDSGPHTLAIYDIEDDEWTNLGEWFDPSMSLRLVDDDALFYVDLNEGMLRSISLR